MATHEGLGNALHKFSLSAVNQIALHRRQIIKKKFLAPLKILHRWASILTCLPMLHIRPPSLSPYQSTKNLIETYHPSDIMLTVTQIRTHVIHIHTHIRSIKQAAAFENDLRPSLN